MRNKVYKNNDIRFLFKSLDKNEQSKKKNGRKDVIKIGSEINDKELQ